MNEPIPNGQARITGHYKEKEVRDLASVLENPLRTPVTIEETRSVSPTLGAESIKSGIVSGVAGLALVMLFVVFYYRLAGTVALVGLWINIILLFGMMAMFHFVLTLPGIAGIILTIGMAVDSNVLIFERIREELRTGKNVVAAVDAGFGKAWWTIVDTHITTIVSCLFLFLFGTGPVKGFAVTLVIGLIANVFTAVFVSKVIFEYELSRKKQVTALSI